MEKKTKMQKQSKKKKNCCKNVYPKKSQKYYFKKPATFSQYKNAEYAVFCDKNFD